MNPPPTSLPITSLWVIPMHQLQACCNLICYWDFPVCATVKESACQCRRHKRHRFNHWFGKIPWRRVWQPTPIFLPGESHGQRSLAAYSQEGHTELNKTEVTWHGYICYYTSVPLLFFHSVPIFQLGRQNNNNNNKNTA